MELLEEMLVRFENNNETVREQTRNVRRETAKARAFECILDIKMLGLRIIDGLLKEVEGEDRKRPAGAIIDPKLDLLDTDAF